MITITVNKSTNIITVETPEKYEFTVTEIDTFINLLRCIFNNFNFMDGDIVKLEVREK